jgi:uncharacterized phiE125 gp8 family phage protein
MSVIMNVSDLEKHLNLPAGQEDADFLYAKIAAAQAQIESATGKRLLTTTEVARFDEFRCRRLELPIAPVQSVTSITYLDENGDQQTLSAADYVLRTDSDAAYIYPTVGKTFPTTLNAAGAVTVTYVAGYGNEGTDVPAPLLEAVKRLAASMYENRESVLVGQQAQDMNDVINLVAPYRRYVF